MNSPSSPEREAASSAPCCSDGTQLPLLSGTPTASESSVRGAATWPTPRTCSAMAATMTESQIAPHRFPNLETVVGRREVSPSTATSETSTPSPAPATSSPAASPASRSVRPGSGSVRMTRATCGHTPFAYWSSQERRWDSSRTCLDFSAQATSEPFSETWPKRGSMRNGACWEQTMWAPRIDASGCGSWPTPMTTQRESTPDQWSERREFFGGTLRATYPPDAVKYQVEERSYPTPQARDGSHGGPQDPAKRRAGGHSVGLDDVVARGASTPQTWATPCCRDTMNHSDLSDLEENAHLSRQAVKRLGETSGSLNPTWVEWLMGWPRGWTDCEHSEMDRCLSAWLQRSRTWLGLRG